MLETRRSRMQWGAAVALAAACLVGIVVLWQTSFNEDPESRVLPPQEISASQLERRVIYRSPQRPGYTSFTGAWLMPDGTPMTGFVQATGPVEPSERELAPASVLTKFGLASIERTRDFWGLRNSLVYMEPGRRDRWRVVRRQRFKAITSHAYTPQANIALKNGEILQRINGDDLRHDPDVPHTAFLVRVPAEKGGQPSEPQVLLDPNKYTYQLTRIRRLRDGRLIATGNVWNTPASTKPSSRLRSRDRSRFLLMVSPDEGRTWRMGLTIPPDTGYLPGNEWDTGELPNGDLVAMIRTFDKPGSDRVEVRKQAILKKQGEGWVLTDLKTTKFPKSGHPELLTTREGAIINIATTGTHYTRDGKTWTKLKFDDAPAYFSGYYPTSVETADNVVHVFSHLGSDDPYGAVNQAVVEDTFEIVTADALPTEE